ncbi:dihydrofolate synthetase Fol3 [Lineolata rhizophorae]|uniref:Dihydrofolate synthetase n=1 Tax=Lineolata rhizophorae TaxID=578093 RepID=A0A6A6NYD7_9PEZI|nr:dihydrofolate synthetase Fol3 [Lineolata rhizophorae]
MIELGLGRISRLVQTSRLSWRAVHVAGTNGKGGVCAYLSNMLQQAGQRCGRFTSPHLVDRWDCVAIDGLPVSESAFRHAEDAVRTRDKADDIRASEFELLTATAFELFTREGVDVAVVECGMGGRLDATNVLDDKLVTVITKIGLDHQSFLGSTVEAIAREKAGIMKPGVPCVADATNDTSVLDVIRSVGREVGSGTVHALDGLPCEQVESMPPHFRNDYGALEPHQKINFSLATTAARIALSSNGLRQATLNSGVLSKALRETQWPGRLQCISIASLTGRVEEVVLDGAHNPQAASALARFLERRFGRVPTTWVLAASEGKDMGGTLSVLLKPGDVVCAVEFGPVDGMPWVKPMVASRLLEAATSVNGIRQAGAYGQSLKTALNDASEIANGGPLVITGSLYLVSGVLRLLRPEPAV